MAPPHQRVTYFLVKWCCAAKSQGTQNKSRDQRQDFTWQRKGKKVYLLRYPAHKWMINSPNHMSVGILRNPSQSNCLFHWTWILSTGEFQKPLSGCIRKFGHVCFQLNLSRVRWCCKILHLSYGPSWVHPHVPINQSWCNSSWNVFLFHILLLTSIALTYDVEQICF